MKLAKDFTNLYKYMRKEHAVNMIEKGKIRIGTLYDYKNEEKYGREIGDSQEGTLTIVVRGKTDGTLTQIDRYEVGGSVITNISFTGTGDAFVETQRITNGYLYCASLSRDINIMKAFGGDTCVEIFDSRMFLMEITKTLVSLNHCHGFPLTAQCIYDKKLIELDNTKPINHKSTDSHLTWLQKDPSYEYQAEVRSYWKSVIKNPIPLIIECEGIKNYCRIIDL